MNPSVTYKSILLLLAFFVISLCFSGCPICNCGQVDPFFDYSSASMESPDVVAAGDSLVVLFVPEDLSFLAESNCTHGWGNALYACSCVGPGYMGPKHLLTEINITSNVPFNSTLGTNLNSVSRYNLEHLLTTIPDWDTDSTYYYGGYGSFQVSISEQPDSTVGPFRITVEVTKSSGETITATSEEIIW